MDAKQNISSIRHFLKKRHWVSDVFAGMCLNAVGKHPMAAMMRDSILCTVPQDRPRI